MRGCTTLMATTSFKPQRNFHVAAAATASTQCPSISWRQGQKRRHIRLQCHQLQHDDADNCLTRNTGIFHPSLWGDFFIGYSNPAAPQQQVNLFI